MPSVAPPTVDNLNALANAAASGATRVHFQDRTVDFASPVELQQAYAFMYNLIYPNTQAAGADGAPPFHRQVRMQTGRGL